MSKKLAQMKQKYMEKLGVLRAFSSAEALLSWDKETHLPSQASSDRGETMSVLSGFIHQEFTSSEFCTAVQYLSEHLEELTPLEKRSVETVSRELNKSLRLPKSFVEDTQLILNDSATAWVQAREKNDFATFLPHLDRVVENRKRYAHFLHPDQHPYTVLLNDYEEGSSLEELQSLFSTLKAELDILLPKILSARSPSKDVFEMPGVSQSQLEGFLKELVKQVGFDLDRGTFGTVTHPFQISISPSDIRLNTCYKERDHAFTILGMVHELGHGLYEQNVDLQYVPYNLGHGTSLGIHESQSRTLENMIGRSEAFWQYALPLLQKHCPQFAHLQLAEVVSSLNRVAPSLIRTESDEVTYNYHVILRFELEVALLTGKLAVKDLPEAWQAKMKELLKISVPSDTQGCLQDVHWSWGNFGYFPTYTLGNLYAASLFRSFAAAHPAWQKEVAVGNFTSYFSWYKAHVWQHGSRYTAAQIFHQATESTLSVDPLIQYLQTKYL